MRLMYQEVHVVVWKRCDIEIDVVKTHLCHGTFDFFIEDFFAEQLLTRSKNQYFTWSKNKNWISRFSDASKQITKTGKMQPPMTEEEPLQRHCTVQESPRGWHAGLRSWSRWLAWELRMVRVKILGGTFLVAELRKCQNYIYKLERFTWRQLAQVPQAGRSWHSRRPLRLPKSCPGLGGSIWDALTGHCHV